MAAGRHLLLTLVLFLCAYPVYAQFLDYGTDPARLSWKYVSTDHYKIIYPAGNDSLAQRYTTLLENAYPFVGKTLNQSIRSRYPVILHSGNMLSNGMVAWAPKRMELVTTPSSSLYAQDWSRQLVLHESRHVFQMNRFMQGIFRPLYYIAGEQVSGLAAFAVPKWFFEGDAVTTETALSGSGRGRLPEFNLYYRTQLLTDDFYSFDKWFMGSYKDYTGNFYALGYDMTAYARYAYGADIWDKVTDRYTRRILHLPPFSKALKKFTGLKNTSALFDETFAFLRTEWEEQDRVNRPFTPVDYISKPVSKGYNSYQYARIINDSTVIALRTALDDLSALVLLTREGEKRLTYITNSNSPLQYAAGRVYWSEYVSGLRWTHENHSVVRYYDLLTGKVQTLTPRQRYLAPAVNRDGSQLVVSEPAFNGENRIVLIGASSGEVIKTYPVRNNAFVKELAYGNDRIYAIVVEDGGMGVLSFDLLTEEWEEILDAGRLNLSSISWHDNKLYLETGWTGINNIYSLNPDNGDLVRLTSARFGAFMPDVSGDKMAYSDYQPHGHRVTVVPVDSLCHQPVEMEDGYTFRLAEAVAAQELVNLDTVTLKPVPFVPRSYRKAAHLFNFHSWAPFYYDVTDAVNLNTDDFTTIVKPGVMVLSQNPLNTAITQLGYYYRKGEHHGMASFIYKGWYPVFDITVDYGGKAFDMGWVKDETDENREYTAGYYTGRNRVEIEARAYVPFNLTRGHYTHGIQPIVSYFFTNDRYQQYRSRSFSNFQYLLAELRYYRYRKMSLRDILPRWGYQLRLQYMTTPMNKDNYGDLYVARLTTYWPGLFRNHSLMLRGGYQYQSLDDKALYVPKRLLDTPRGYSYNYRSYQQFAFKADYAFSLFCPDWSLGSWAYIQRVRTNLFYDLSRTQANKSSDWTSQSSFGADLIADWNIFRLNYPISLGIRVISPIDYGNVQVEGLFSVSF